MKSTLQSLESEIAKLNEDLTERKQQIDAANDEIKKINLSLQVAEKTIVDMKKQVEE